VAFEVRTAAPSDFITSAGHRGALPEGAVLIPGEPAHDRIPGETAHDR
jgi:hypothetical protein